MNKVVAWRASMNTRRRDVNVDNVLEDLVVAIRSGDKETAIGMLKDYAANDYDRERIELAWRAVLR